MPVKGLRERDQAIVAIVGTVLIGAGVLFALGFNQLPFLHPSTTYTAEFANSGGLQSGDDVRVAGVSGGSVDSVALAGDHVQVKFTVKRGLALGGQSTATIEIATVLGNVFLQVESAGPGHLRSGVPIPVGRTTVPFTLLDAFGDFASNVQRANVPTLEQSLTELSATLNGISKPAIEATLTGLTKLSQALASRQDEIAELITSAQQVIDMLQSKGSAIVNVLSNSDTFLRMLNARHEVIRKLFEDTAALGAEITSLIQTDGAPLSAALANVDKLSAILAKDDAQLRRSITLLGQFSVNIANVTGSGPWIDILLPTDLIPDNVIATCGVHPKPGCGN